MNAWIDADTGSRTATENDIDAIARLIALTFVDDPCWGPALNARGDAAHADAARSDAARSGGAPADAAHAGAAHAGGGDGGSASSVNGSVGGGVGGSNLADFWRPYVIAAIPYGLVDVVDAEDGGIASAALWIPPGQPELTPEGEVIMLDVARKRLSPQGFTDLEELFSRFEAVHPQHEPHAYLSILATHPDYRGRGLAQRMVAERLQKLDREGIPAYLESSNPDNDRRYLRLGFHELVRFSTVINPVSIGIFWHDPDGSTGPGKA